ELQRGRARTRSGGSGRRARARGRMVSQRSSHRDGGCIREGEGVSVLNVALPLGSGVLSLAFAALVFDQWWQRRHAFQLVWSIRSRTCPSEAVSPDTFAS